MSDDELTAAQAAALTASVDIDAPPPDGMPVASVLFGTNQAAPARIAAERYHNGAAPLIIATGGVNRHNGIVEGREFARQLAGAGLPVSVIRVEDQSKDTRQNVELSMPYLREALTAGLPLVTVSKWYHLRAVYCLRTQLPEAVPLYAIGWEPLYAGTLVTRENWPSSPDGCRRVIRESQEVPRRVAEGSYLPGREERRRLAVMLTSACANALSAPSRAEGRGHMRHRSSHSDHLRQPHVRKGVHTKPFLVPASAAVLLAVAACSSASSSASIPISAPSSTASAVPSASVPPPSASPVSAVPGSNGNEYIAGPFMVAIKGTGALPSSLPVAICERCVAAWMRERSRNFKAVESPGWRPRG